MQFTGPDVAASRVADSLPGPRDLAGLEPIERIRSRWPLILGGLLTLLMIAALARELFGSGLAGLQNNVPGHPLFWLAFALYYLGPPTFDYLIFRRLWNIPPGGMAALHKKRISNEVLLGYSGEAYFYAWARQRTKMIAAPFGAVKDVAIMSAVAGNAMTVGMILLAAPFVTSLPEEVTANTVIASVALLLLVSLPVAVFAKRLFSLPRETLWWVFGMHMARLAFGSLFIVMAWHYALPGVAIGTWLFLSVLRLVCSRLPLVPNKELVFASFAMLLLGEGAALSELTAVIAALTLLAHGALMLGLSVYGAVEKRI